MRPIDADRLIEVFENQDDWSAQMDLAQICSMNFYSLVGSQPTLSYRSMREFFTSEEFKERRYKVRRYRVKDSGFQMKQEETMMNKLNQTVEMLKTITASANAAKEIEGITNEDVRNILLGNMTTIMGDIALSLAIIAEDTESIRKVDFVEE